MGLNSIFLNMKYITSFNEHSKNEAIPEILDAQRGIALFVIGAPGIGKSKGLI